MKHEPHGAVPGPELSDQALDRQLAHLHETEDDVQARSQDARENHAERTAELEAEAERREQG